MSKISIITINRNNAEGLDLTIKSVINQCYDNYEYIIIDGASTDNSVDVIKKSESKITHWVSESDKGVYDAMNKGTDIASGDWICFMNSGDVFYDNNVLKNIFINHEGIVSESDIIYGNTVLVTYSLKFALRPDLINTMPVNKPFCHQSAFVRCGIQKKYKFDLTYKICADHAFFLLLYKANYRFNYINLIVSEFETIESLSSNNTNLVVRENYTIQNAKKGVRMYLNILKIKIVKPLSRRLDLLCSKNMFLLENKIKRMSKRDNIIWVQKK